MKKNFALIAAGSLLALGTPAFAHEAHVHGLARMNLAIEGREVEIELKTPLANLLSFEHEPETEAQKKEAGDMAAIMRGAGSLFIMPAEAQCRLNEVSLESDAISDTLLHPGQPGRIEKKHSGEHGDLDVEISFMCLKPEKLNSITVDLFRFFPKLRKVEAHMATSKGQHSVELTPGSNIIRRP